MEICFNCKNEYKNKQALGAHQFFCLNPENKVIMSRRRKQKNKERWANDKGKSLEEIYGEAKANDIKEKLSESHKGQEAHNKGKTFEDYYGKEKGEKIKTKLSESHKKRCKNMSEEERYNLAKRIIDAPKSQEWRKEIDEETGKTKGQLVREKLSDSLFEQYKTGKRKNSGGGRTSWYTLDTSNGKVKVQGSYEKRTVFILEEFKRKNQIHNWEYTNDRFEYFDYKGIKRNYLLDFKIWANKNIFYYLEVKGYQNLNDEFKWAAVRNKGYELYVWFKEDIEKIETDIKGYVI